jgi:hypothetical protein
MISLDSRLHGDALVLRDSMIKFDGSTWPDIEICDAPYKPLSMYLNRPLIKILEDMGVPDDFFLDLQAKEVERLRTVLFKVSFQVETHTDPKNRSQIVQSMQLLS